MENQKPLSFIDIISSSVINLRSGSSITLSDIIIALIASLICAGIISYTYKYTYQVNILTKEFYIKKVLIYL